MQRPGFFPPLVSILKVVNMRIIDHFLLQPGAPVYKSLWVGLGLTDNVVPKNFLMDLNLRIRLSEGEGARKTASHTGLRTCTSRLGVYAVDTGDEVLLK